MKILYDYQIFELQSYGGASRYFYEIINGLKVNNFAEVDLAIEYSNNAYLKNDPYYSNIIKPIKPYRELWPKLHFKGKGRIFNIAQSLNLINSGHSKNLKGAKGKIINGHYDVFHPTYYNDYFLKYITDKPIVITILDMIYEYFPQYFCDYVQVNLLKKILAEKATKIIAISQNTKNDVVKFLKIPEDKIIVIHLGNSLKVENKNNNNLNKFSSIPERYILYVGSRGTYKNFPFFIKSIQKILKRDEDLKIVCAGGSSFTREEIELFSKLNISKQIIYLPIDDNMLINLYKNAIAFIYPSLYEGFGIPIIEAFACGCPNILADSSCFPEIAGDAAIYFNPDNEDSLVESIDVLINNADLRNELVSKGLERLKDFSLEKSAKQTLEVYKSCISG